MNYPITRWIFLRLLGLVHLTAFASYAVQIIGLNGSHGILPTANMLSQVAENMGWQRYWLCPTVAWLSCSDAVLQGITYAGVALAILVMLGIATGPALAALLILWLSLVSGGGEFTGFQSDGMLVEATFLSLLFAPWCVCEPPWPVPLQWRLQRPPAPASVWVLRFMTFRLMFASGVVKILSGDPTWQDFTAMSYHYETQPIPTPLAWYVHHFPLWLQKFSVAGTFFSELIAPLLIFGPRKCRLIAAGAITLIHILISLTGNYTFLNLLAIVLCVPLLDDTLVQSAMPKRLVESIEQSQDVRPAGRLQRACVTAAAAALIFVAGTELTATFFGSWVLPPAVRYLQVYLSPFHLADRYGLFAVMTTTRPEIVFEGSEDGKIWQSYEFKYKPGDNLRRPPPWVEPHMPRLDWRLWFAAMEPVENSPWVFALVIRMLEGSADLDMFFERNPFAGTRPKYIRAYVYDYHFTTEQERAATGDWWRRDNQRVYLPPVELKNGQLVIADR